MIKEKEALEKVYYGSQGYGDCDENYKIVKQALDRLEAIDNAEPSEALKEIFNIIYNLECGTTFEQDKKLNECRDVIKKALLKAQEPKKDYLKWSQIRDMPREFKVKMGNDIYVVKYEYWGATDIDVSLFQANGLFMFYLHESFIENLHLEVIEE